VHSKPKILPGREALSLTQYIVAGTNWRFASVDNPRRIEQERYVKMLKQMKHRTYKNSHAGNNNTTFNDK
jgi:hypothetical protein